MRVLLVRPDSSMTVRPVPLGLGYVAGALRARRNDAIRVLDARNRRIGAAKVADEARAFGADVVGISSCSADSVEAHGLARALRAALPAARIVIGGPYASASREAVLDDPSVDAAVIGEGEDAFAELLDAWEGGSGDLSQVKGIVHRQGGEARYTGARTLPRDLDGLRPAWDLLDLPSYFRPLRKNTQNQVKVDCRAVPIFTSRGCPHNCIFCHNVFGRKFRARSPEAVVDEIDMLVRDYGVREVEIVDDCFNQDMDRAKDILRRIAARPYRLHLSLPNGVRGDLVDEEMVDLFKAAGMVRISYAIESASPRVQKLIRKNIDLDAVGRAITLTARRGIATSGFFIMGFPTETAREMRETADWAAASDLHLAELFYLNPFPGTEVARMAGVDASRVFMPDYSTIALNLSAATDAEMRSEMRRAYRRFYLDPVRIARILKVVPKNAYLLQNMVLTARLILFDAVMRTG